MQKQRAFISGLSSGPLTLLMQRVCTEGPDSGGWGSLFIGARQRNEEKIV